MTVRISPWVRTSIGYRYKGGWGSVSVSSGYWLLATGWCTLLLSCLRCGSARKRGKKVSTYLPPSPIGGGV